MDVGMGMGMGMGIVGYLLRARTSDWGESTLHSFGYASCGLSFASTDDCSCMCIHKLKLARYVSAAAGCPPPPRQH
jgi:hypothetical protein